MPAGKLAAMAGHAFLDSYHESLTRRPAIAELYQRDRTGIKITLRAASEWQLLRARDQALKAGLPCALIIDQHHLLPPHFTGEPIITALGIGPARQDEIASITRRFQLLK